VKETNMDIIAWAFFGMAIGLSIWVITHTKRR
jgi:hypothetical protein